MTNTNKEQAMLRISLIPLVIIVALILGTGYFLMEGEIKLPKFKKGPQIRRMEGFPTVIYTDKPLDKSRHIITTEEQLNEFLNYVDDTGLLGLKENINFEREYLLAVSSETEDETDHEIKIRKVYEDKENRKLIVSIREREPGKNCDPEADSNVNVDIVAVSKTDWEIDFEKVKEVVECN
jgi:hypothetical protein